MKLRPFFPLATVIAIVLLLPNCVMVDPQYASLETRVLTNPSPESIVGMWYHNENESFVNSKTTFSYLFKSDGTGINRNKVSSWSGESEFTWKYTGQGQWTLTWLLEGATYTAQVRTTGDRLLMLNQKGAKVVLVKSE